MKNLAVCYTGIQKIEVREEPMPIIDDHQVLVQTLSSAISAGTEMHFYEGLGSTDIPLDENIPFLAELPDYPFKYGYASVGKVIECGKAVPKEWTDRLVFAFHPHQSYFSAEPTNLIRIHGLPVEDAVFLANMETAVNFMMDGKPLIGERVMVFGQGVVGLLTTSLLAQMPLRQLITAELHAMRRSKSLEYGAHACLDPSQANFGEAVRLLLEGNKADLVYEVSGNPQALEQAIQLTAFGGRVIIGSWYGKKQDKVKLNSHFHRRRVNLISSQVSTLAPEFTGTWSKLRRIDVALGLLPHIEPSRLITHRVPIEEADKAYKLLAQNPEQTIGVILTY